LQATLGEIKPRRSDAGLENDGAASIPANLCPRASQRETKEAIMQARADRVLDELRRVVTQAQQVLESGTTVSRRVGAGLVDARDRVVALEQAATRRAREAAEEADRYAHEHPWRVLVGGIAVAAVVAIALTMIATPRRD
jgi:ElaB/YqjD/DUF883 family membrane-anchored ribosome-binding protein